MAVRLFTAEPEPERKRKMPFWKRVFVFFIMVLFAALLLASVMFFRALPRMKKIIANAARNKASSEIDEAILSYMETNEITYGKLIQATFDQNGAITSVTADTAKVDAIIARMDDEIGSELEEKLMETSIPLYVLMGTDVFFSGGPRIKVHFFPLNIVNVNTRHEFTSQGINQTLHTVYLDISVDIEVLLPIKNSIETVDTTILLGQTLIVGGVPETYVRHN